MWCKAAIIAAQHLPYKLLVVSAPLDFAFLQYFMPTQKQIQSQKLIALSKEVGLPVRELILSDVNLEQVAPIFYEGLPKLARMTMNRDKFKAFFVKQRQQIADELFPVKG